MAGYAFKKFQTEYPNDAACLAKLMEIQFRSPSSEACRSAAI